MIFFPYFDFSSIIRAKILYASYFFLQKSLHAISDQLSNAKSKSFLPPKLGTLGKLMSINRSCPGMSERLVFCFLFSLFCLANTVNFSGCKSTRNFYTSLGSGGPGNCLTMVA